MFCLKNQFFRDFFCKSSRIAKSSLCILVWVGYTTNNWKLRVVEETAKQRPGRKLRYIYMYFLHIKNIQIFI